MNLRHQFFPRLRVEQFEDKQGVRTGTAQILREFANTPEYRPAGHFVVRGDLRVDGSNKNVFMKRGGVTNVQPTISINALYV